MAVIFDQLKETIQEFFRTRGGVEFKILTLPDPPADAGYVRLYRSSDGYFYEVDSDGHRSIIAGSGEGPGGSGNNYFPGGWL